MRIIVALSFLLVLSACDSLPEWLGGSSSDKPKLAGTRIEVLSEVTHIKADDSIGNVEVTLPEQKNNENWRQAAGSPAGMGGNLAFSGFKNHDKVRIGDGNAWEQPLYSAPVIAGGMVFAMDAKGYITAHDAVDTGKIRWTSKSAVAEDEADILGGGLAFDNGHLYVTTGRGEVFALDAANGNQLWKQSMGVPLRAAPKAGGGKLYCISVDNQIFALDAEKGTQIWSQRGINENAGFLAAISPALNDNTVIAPYSSGEIHALDTTTGQELWSDTVIRASHTAAIARFSGIGGNPVIRDDAVYVAGSNGYFAVFSLTSGRRIWQQEISSLNTPWLTDNFIYIISTDNELICLERSDGRVKWVKQLPAYEDEKKHKNPYFWRGPVMAADTLLVAGSYGQMLVISPKNGDTVNTIDIPEDITNAPIIASGRLYLIGKNAKLHVYY